MPFHVSAWLHIVTLPRFREKPFYLKQTTFVAAKETKNDTKPINDSDSSLKMKVRSHWTVFQILLLSEVICI